MNVTGLRCTLCHRTYALGEVEYTCPSCGIDGILDVEYDYDRARRELNADALAHDARVSIWRYLPVLPFEPGAQLPRLRVGWTPIYEAPRLARELGVRAAWVKDDGLASTASFKDRASAVGVARAVTLGRTEIACASTGNAASSLAGFAADAGLAARIFVPKSAPEAKVAQLLVYGAKVFLVDGSYDVAWDLCQKATEHFGWYNRNCAVNPFLVEGKKTGGLEIGEQMRGHLPDVVAVSVGDGCTIAGIGKGLVEMKQLGIIDRVPRLLGVQAEGAAPLAKAFAAGTETLEPIESQSVADSINVGHPRNWRKALRAVKTGGGAFVTVSDEQILAMIPRLARTTGVFAEPAASAALAGVFRARELSLINQDESVLVMSTGSGLKDIRSAMRTVTLPKPIAPTLEEVRRALTVA